jgi:hypothetical protein
MAHNPELYAINGELQLLAVRKHLPDVLKDDLNRLPEERSAAVPGCEFEHRPGACFPDWRRDAAATRRRGRLRYAHV